MNRQKGFLSIAAVAIIVIFAILCAMMVSMFIYSSRSALNLNAIKRASGLAQSGLEQGYANLKDFTNSQICATLSVTNNALPTGGFTVTGATPSTAFNTLSTSIASSGAISTITVSSTSGFETFGEVIIGSEIFKYFGTTATTFTGVSRAQNGSLSAAHSSGDLVSQYQCRISATGNSPATSPFATRQYQFGVPPGAILYSAGAAGTILRWDGKTWGSMASGTAVILYGISILNYHTGWAVGALSGTSFVIKRLNGSSWTDNTTTAAALGIGQSRDLNAVQTVSPQEAWAVGNESNANRLVLLRWTPSAWCAVTMSPTTACGGKTISLSSGGGTQNLYSISTIDNDGDGIANFGIIGVGGTTAAAQGLLLSYNGSTWQNLGAAAAPSPTTYRFGRVNSVVLVRNGTSPSQEVFFASAHRDASQGMILRGRITSYSPLSITWTPSPNGFITPAEMRGVSVIDTDNDGLANFGFAVGLGGRIYSYNGSTWALNTTIAGVDLHSVIVFSTTDAWAAGASGNRYHWNGTNWTAFNTVSSANQVNSLSGLAPQPSPIPWYDVVN